MTFLLLLFTGGIVTWLCLWTRTESTPPGAWFPFEIRDAEGAEEASPIERKKPWRRDAHPAAPARAAVVERDRRERPWKRSDS